MAISRYKVSILLCISIGDTWRLHLKVFPSVPRRALRYALLAMTKTESFSVNKLVGATIRRPQAAIGRPYIQWM